MSTTIYGNDCRIYTSKAGAYVAAFITYDFSSTATTYSISLSAGGRVKVGPYGGDHGMTSASAVANSTITGTGKSAISGSATVSATAGPYEGVTKNTTILSTWTWTWNKSHVQQPITISYTINGSRISGNSVVSFSFTIPAKASYSINYNGNGATSGSTTGQTKWYDESLSLNANGYSRTGYTFSKWNTVAGGTGTNYNAGASYTTNAAATLYAQWTANTYTVTLNQNHSEGTTSNLTRTYNSSFTIPASSIPTRRYYNFLGWSESSTATSPTYKHTGITSGTCTISTFNTTVGEKTLYAVWKRDYWQPIISNFKAYRVNSATSSTETNEGTYIYISFDYQGGTDTWGEAQSGGIPGYFSPSFQITINNQLVASGDGATALVIDESTGKGSYSAAFGIYSTTTKHNIVITLFDINYAPINTVVTAQIPTAIYPIDLIGDGVNVYMGVLHTAISGQQLTTSHLSVDDNIYLYLDMDSGDTNNVDFQLKRALYNLRWNDDVIIN